MAGGWLEWYWGCTLWAFSLTNMSMLIDVRYWREAAYQSRRQVARLKMLLRLLDKLHKMQIEALTGISPEQRSTGGQNGQAEQESHYGEQRP